MMLKVHIEGANAYEVGDEIWQQPLAGAICSEAETIADYAGPDLVAVQDRAHREQLRDRIVAAMTSALVNVGDRYRAPDGVLYTLLDEPLRDPRAGAGTLSTMSTPASEPTVDEVLRFEHLPLGSAGSRRAIVRWSDGTESNAMTWYADEILVCEGDLVGKTLAEIRALHFRRDRDWLQS
jgi:hypothetical protein